MDRKIIHMDIDAFYASVEELDNPNYKGRPLIVGGKSSRGVVSTCNYEARKFGIYSSMPIFKAEKLCPHASFVFPRMARYIEISRDVFSIVNEYANHLEKVSIDEAYIDVTDLYNSPDYIGKKIKERVKSETGMVISIGISYNKFLAKLASDWDKPDGFYKITKDMIPDVLRPLPISKVHGLGKKSVAKLNKIGIFTICDMLKYSRNFYEDLFGKHGIEIYDRIRGIDDREVLMSDEVKSIGRETTLSEDTASEEIIWSYLEKFSEKISNSMSNRGLYCHTVTIKIKFEDFSVITRSKTVEHNIKNKEEILEVGREIFKNISVNKKVRLIGISISNFVESKFEQLNIFDII